jgi:thiol-disulfide isomerase/thioredoxin
MIRILTAATVCLASACGGEFTPSLLSQFKGSVTVVTFISARCVVSNAYGARFEVLYKEYTPRGVRFLFVNSNSNETAQEIEENTTNQRYSFQVYRDATSQAANLLGAELTPESFVLDRDAVVRYRGAVDDSQNPARVKKRSLRLALDAVLAGKQVETAQTKAFGCTIKRPRTEQFRPLAAHDYAKLVAGYRGKILLVDFWATWCAPCRDELPPLALLAARLPFQLVTVSADDSDHAAEALQFLRTSRVAEPFFLKSTEDNDGFINAIDPAWSGALPALFLYDSSGRLARSFTGEVQIQEVEAAIRKLL